MPSLRRLVPGRRLALALALTIAPTLALGYFGYNALGDRERSLRLSLTSSGTLVRDRLTASLAALEDSVVAAAGSLPDRADRGALQEWLRTLAHDRPWLQHVFLTTATGGFLTADSRTGWGDLSPPMDATNDAAAALRKGEAAEFAAGNLDDALEHYKRAVSTAADGVQRAAALTRVGRTHLKLNRQAEARIAYRQVLTMPGTLADPYGVPYHLIALVQLAEPGPPDLLQYVLDHPWDARSSYAFYLRRALDQSTTAPADLMSRGRERLVAVEQFERLVAQVEPLMRRPPQKGPLRAVLEAGPSSSLLCLRSLPNSISSEPLSLGLIIQLDYVTHTMIEAAATGLDLGDDVDVRIVGASDTTAGQSLATVALDTALPGYDIAIVDRRGRTLAQVTARERWTYGALLGGVFAVLLAGVTFMARAWAREAELSRLQTDFVSNVSHELKTPLSLIRMFGETLESGAVNDAAKRREFYGIIRRESERLTHLINNILDAARIENGSRTFVREPTDVVALVRDALNAYGSLFARLNVEVAAELPDTPISVRLDRDAVAQALVNLFQNAIRYAGEGRHVSVTVGRTTDEVSVAVADRGPGIPRVELRRIFDKFYRSRATAGATAGSGLGLAIVQHVMSEHGGRVEVDSTVGQGSVFTLVFPIEGSGS